LQPGFDGRGGATSLWAKKVDPAREALRREAARKRTEMLRKAEQVRAQKEAEKAVYSRSAAEPEEEEEEDEEEAAPPPLPRPSMKMPPKPEPKRASPKPFLSPKPKPAPRPVARQMPAVKAAPNAAPKPTAGTDRLPSAGEVHQMKVIDLKEALRSVGLKVSGRKAELAERLLAHLETAR